MTLAQLREALEAQRGRVLAFIDGLEEQEFDRKARTSALQTVHGHR